MREFTDREKRILRVFGGSGACAIADENETYVTLVTNSTQLQVWELGIVNDAYHEVVAVGWNRECGRMTLVIQKDIATRQEAEHEDQDR